MAENEVKDQVTDQTSEETEVPKADAAETEKTESPEESSQNEAEKGAEAGESEKPEEAGKPEESAQDEDLQTKFLRLSADFQNYRRRVDKEKSDIYAYANEKIVLQLLEVMDNFERAMQTADPDDKYAQGVGLIFKQLEDLLRKNNVEEIEALGKSFDPAYHNAVMTEAADDAEPGTITKVLQKGYTMNSKVIRPSMVAVSE